MKQLQTVLASLLIASISITTHVHAHDHKEKSHAGHKEIKQEESKMHHGKHDAHKMQHDSKDATKKVSNLVIKKAMIRETPPGTSVAAGYLSISNTGNEDDTLLNINTDITDIVQVHEMKMEKNVMKMSQIPSNLVIPKGETVILEPGGLHLMFMNLKEQLTAGNTKNVTLNFAKAGKVEIAFPIKKAGTKKHHH